MLLGGGGHCRSVLDCLIRSGKYDEIGIVDKEFKATDNILGIPFVGTDSDLQRLFSEGWTNASVTVGSIGETHVRYKLYKKLIETGFELPPIIDPSSVISDNVKIGEGVFVGKNAVVNSGVEIKSCAIINTGAIVEHDCIIGEFAHISSGSVLCGEITVGDNTHIGAGSVVRQGISVGNNTIIGIGSVVVENIGSEIMAFGNPCKAFKHLQ